MVKILKSRFQEMYKLRNKSERFLGMTIESYPKEKDGRITYRSLQRCLTEGNMQHETLMLCAEILRCSPKYLTGELTEKGFYMEDPDDPSDLENEGLSPEMINLIMNDRKRHKQYVDSNNLYVGHYEDALKEEAVYRFKKWIECANFMICINDFGFKYTYLDYKKDEAVYDAETGLTRSLFESIESDMDMLIRELTDSMYEFYEVYNLKKTNPEEYHRIIESIKNRETEDN